MMVELVFSLITPAVLLGAWATGSLIERLHLRELRRLESGSKDVLALTIEDIPADWEVEGCDLVLGNVVISQDYFKRVAASLKGIVGGRIGVYEPLLERARREALIRMKEQARDRGRDTIINVRIETSPLARTRGDGKGTAGVEIMAFGTAVSLRGGRSRRIGPGGVPA
jgi:uncharacterized protein YbjQ (UPF0145 family)